MPIEKSKFLKTRDELVTGFGGCTAMTPAEGSWMYRDTKMSDTNSGFYVVTPYTKDVIRSDNTIYKGRIFNYQTIYNIPADMQYTLPILHIT